MSETYVLLLLQMAVTAVLITAIVKAFRQSSTELRLSFVSATVMAVVGSFGVLVGYFLPVLSESSGGFASVLIPVTTAVAVVSIGMWILFFANYASLAGKYTRLLKVGMGGVLLTALVTVTNPFHELVFEGFVLQESISGGLFLASPSVVSLVLFGFVGFVLLTTLGMVFSVADPDNVGDVAVGAVGIGILLVGLGTVLTAFGVVVPVALTSSVFAVTTMYAAGRSEVFESSQTAEMDVFDSVNTPVYAVSKDSGIIYKNRVADTQSGSANTLDEQVVTQAAKSDDGAEKINVEIDEQTRIYDVHISEGEELRIVHLFDVTEYESRIKTIEDERDQLDKFAASVMNEYSQRVEHLNVVMEEFTGIVSHDIRSPLQVAQTYTDMISVDSADKIAQSLERVEALIDRAVELARKGQPVNDPSPISFHQATSYAWSVTHTEQAELELEVPEGTTITAERERLVSLLNHLFMNAVTHGGSDVTVRVGLLDDGFYVEDNGVGIESDMHERVLKKGYTTKEDSTGLGLSIVQRIAGAHEWTVEMTEGDTDGVRFEFGHVDIQPPSPVDADNIMSEQAN